MKLICQKWEESERGYGTRPDGYSLHRSRADLHKYIQEHNDKLPAEPPDEYSKPCGEPYECEVNDPPTVLCVDRDGHMRMYHDNYPEPTDGSSPTGWVPLPGGGGLGRVDTPAETELKKAVFEGVENLPRVDVQRFSVRGLALAPEYKSLLLTSYQAACEYSDRFPEESRPQILENLKLWFMKTGEPAALVPALSEERLEKLKASYPLIEKKLPEPLEVQDFETRVITAVANSRVMEDLRGKIGVREEPAKRNTGADVDRLLEAARWSSPGQADHVTKDPVPWHLSSEDGRPIDFYFDQPLPVETVTLLAKAMGDLMNRMPHLKALTFRVETKT